MTPEKDDRQSRPIAMFIHDICNPLTVISAVAQRICRRDDIDDWLRRDAERIRAAVERIQESLGDLEDHREEAPRS